MSVIGWEVELCPMDAQCGDTGLAAWAPSNHVAWTEAECGVCSVPGERKWICLPTDELQPLHGMATLPEFPSDLPAAFARGSSCCETPDAGIMPRKLFNPYTPPTNFHLTIKYYQAAEGTNDQ